MYRVIVCGSRIWRDRQRLYGHLDALKAKHGPDLVIIHGACSRGADRMASDWCTLTGTNEIKFPADWDRYGKRAGFVRNSEMAKFKPKADLCMAFWDGASNGTGMMLKLAEKEGVDTGQIVDTELEGKGT